MEMQYASKGVAGAGLGLGIAGTALGLMGSGILNGCGNGPFGGWNRGGCGCSEDQFVTRYESQKDQEISAKDSRIALLESNIYTDQKLTDVFERVSLRIGALEKVVGENTCSQAVTNQKLADNITFVDSKFANVQKDIDCKVGALRCYVDATFVPGKLVMPLDAICPAAQPATTPAAAAAAK